MKKAKLFKLASPFLALVLALSFSLVTAVPAGAVDEGVRDREAAILAAADNLVLKQSNDGGFDWIYDDDLTDSSGANVLGITAIGILKAHELDDKEAYETALAEAYGYATLNTGRYVYPDVTFLVWLADAAEADTSLLDAIDTEVPGTTIQDIRTLAQSIWTTRMAGGTYGTDGLNLDAAGRAVKELEARYTSYAGLGFWDLEAAVKAALALGLDADAQAIAGVMYANLQSGSDYYFDIADTSTICYVLALSGTIEAFLEVGVYPTMARTMTDELIAFQDETGFWDEVDVSMWEESIQSTAYAVMALVKQGDDDAVVAAREGADWLVGRQNVDGGWDPCEKGYDVELLEADSEAAWALATAEAPVTIGTDGYYSIQSAIDSATEGDTISVPAGTYTEDLVINKAGLTIQSQTGKGNTTIQLVDLVGISLEAGADDFTLGGTVGQGFTILGDAGATTRNIELISGPSGVEISHNTIDTTGYASMGISVGAAGATGLEITKNTFIAEEGDGSIWGPEVVGVTVSDNTFTGPGGVVSGYAVQFSGVTGTSVISRNIITGYGLGVAIANGQATSGLTIEDNTISGCAIGIWFMDYCAQGTAGNMTTVAVTQNVLSNNTKGIRIGAGEHVVASYFSIKYNNIDGNTEFGVVNENAEVVDATRNWWGDASGPSNVGPGSGDAVSSGVDYEFWLGAAHDITILSGNPVAMIEITAPGDMSEWLLKPGMSNTKTGTLNVKCNTAWQVTASDEEPDTGGQMTEWTGSIYNTLRKLENAMEVWAATGVVDLATGGLIDTGTETEALTAGDTGENITVTFKQRVSYADAILASPNCYCIVVTFTGSTTI